MDFNSLGADARAALWVAVAAAGVHWYARPFLRFLTPALVLGVAYRSLLAGEDADPSVLQRVVQALDAFGARDGVPGSVVRALEDVIGIVVVASAIRALIAVARTTPAKAAAGLSEAAWDLLTSVRLPVISAKIDAELAKNEAAIEGMFERDPTVERLTRLPLKGRSDKEILAFMDASAREEDRKWMEGKVSGAVYSGEEEHLAVQNHAFARYALSNPLHPDIWPSLRKFEAEVVQMTCSLLGGGSESVVGCLTSGGTESIILAAKAHRDYYRKARGITAPEIVVAATAHAAIDKACALLGIKLVKVPVDQRTFKADVGAMRRAVNSNTVMLYSSAPSFPQGVIDDIPALAAVALAADCGLHVDCCLGGFVLPFARKLGYADIPDFDFGVRGVTSMSCDTHKYGYAVKGTSVVMYANKALRHAQYFCFPDWTGGLYSTPTIAGSRPGALSAATWASMVRLGEEGYKQRVKAIMDTTQSIAAEVRRIPGLKLMGDPRAMIVCFGSDETNIYRVDELMGKRGWSLNGLQNPPSIHLCVTYRHVQEGYWRNFVDDLRECTAEVMCDPTAKPDPDSKAGIYGAAASLPAGAVSTSLNCYMDVVLRA